MRAAAIGRAPFRRLRSIFGAPPKNEGTDRALGRPPADPRKGRSLGRPFLFQTRPLTRHVSTNPGPAHWQESMAADIQRRVSAGSFHLIDLATAVVDRLAALRGPCESYSDVILRLVKMEAGSL